MSANLSTYFRPIGREPENSYTTRAVTLTDDAPEWLRDAIHDAHDALGSGLPSDWISEACEAICDDPESDSEPEVYTHHLLLWAADYHWLMDEARDEFGHGDIPQSFADQATSGQYLALSRIADIMREAIDANAEETD